MRVGRFTYVCFSPDEGLLRFCPGDFSIKRT